MSSDSDEYSDEDYQPEKDLQEAGSEIETDDDLDEPDDDQQADHPAKRPKSTKATPRKKAKTSEDAKTVDEPPKAALDDEEAEKERANALWADFLGDSAGDSSAKEERPVAKKAEVAVKPVVPEKKADPVIIKEIFEFAGEEVVVEKKVTATDDVLGKQTGSSTKTIIPTGRAGSGGGALGSILGALNKKNKISTLEKTKLDWTRFKDQEGITEDLNTHNKGKDGYLERQDFLERTDVRQFEIEKSLRQTKRSNR